MSGLNSKTVAALAAAAVLAAASCPAMADFLTLSPTDAQAVTNDGSSWTVNPTDDGLNASRFTGLGLERRGIMEFNLSAIPAGATITAATFNYTIAQYTYSTGSYPQIQFHGYAGNGVMEAADATRPFNLIGTSPTIDTLASYTTSFTPGYVQSLLGTGSQLGVFTYQGAIDHQAEFYSTDATYVSADKRPTLTIQYTPPPPPAPYIYVTGYDSNVREYSPAGTLVDTLPVPAAPGAYDREPRGTAVDYQGRIHVYNGTFDPAVSTYDPSTTSWTHRTAPGLSTINNGSYGAVATFGSYVFASDMRISGDASNGVVRFNTATGAVDRFAGSPDHSDDVSNLTRGLDGLLYTLSGSSTERTSVRAYDPYSLALVRTVNLAAGVRGIAVNAAGEIYGASWGGTLYKFTPAGAVANSLSLGGNLSDLDLAADGSIVVGSWYTGVHLTSESFASHSLIVSSSQDAEFVTFATPAPLNGWSSTATPGGNWSDPANWVGPVPNSASGDAASIANFGPANPGAHDVALLTGQNFTVSTINFDSPTSYKLSGGGTITLDRPTGRPVVNLVTGQHSLWTHLVLAKPAIITQAAGAQFILVGTRGVVDIGPHNLIWDYAPGESPADAVRTCLSHGYHGGDWAGDAYGVITSSAAAADSSRLTAIAYAEASTLGLTTFDGRSVDASALILVLARYGDANLDGQVDADDYALLDRSYARSLSSAHWTDGDFNYDGQITPDDYLLIDTTLGQTQGLSPALLSQRESQFGAQYVSALLTAVPEPAIALSSILYFLPSLLRPRRRRA